MAKQSVQNFDKSVCNGCPHRVRKGESTGSHGVVDNLADLENSVIEGVTGEATYKCGLCGCPLTNLALTNMAPAHCPRLDQHDGGRL